MHREHITYKKKKSEFFSQKFEFFLHGHFSFRTVLFLRDDLATGTDHLGLARGKIALYEVIREREERERETMKKFSKIDRDD